MAENKLNWNDSNPAATDGHVNIAFQAVTPDPDPTVNRDTSAQVRNVGGVVVKTTNYLAVMADLGKSIVMNGTGLTLTLPASPPDAKWWIVVGNINASGATVARNGLTIDGAASNITLNQFKSVRVCTDGTNYFSERGIGGAGSSGVPIGGTAGQVLAKIDATDYNTEWIDEAGSGITLRTDSVDNAVQTILDLRGGSNVTLTDEGDGRVTIAVPAGGGIGAGSLSISKSAAPSTLNLTTEGTIDWLSGGFANLNQSSIIHNKATGGWLRRGFQFTFGGVSQTQSSFTGGGPTAVTATASDDEGNAAWTTFSPGSYVAGTVVAPGSGFRIIVPALKLARVLKLYVRAQHMAADVNAKLTDNSAAPVSVSMSSESSLIEIDFTGGSSADLVVNVVGTSATGVAAMQIDFIAATLA